MGISLMLAGNMGMGAYNKLNAHGISVIRGCHGKVEEVLNAFQQGLLTDSLEACDHQDIQSDVGNAGNCQEEQRVLRVAQCAQDRRARAARHHRHQPAVR